jgi:hypothetical protein
MITPTSAVIVVPLRGALRSATKQQATQRERGLHAGQTSGRAGLKAPHYTGKPRMSRLWLGNRTTGRDSMKITHIRL